MATEKRLIDKQTTIKLLRGQCVSKYPSTFMMGLFAAADEIAQISEVDAVEVDALRAWLYEMAMNNVGVPVADFAAACEEIISRLDGLRAFAEGRRDK